MATDPTTFDDLVENLGGQQGEYDLLFPVIPIVDDPSPPEDDMMVEVDDIADFAADEIGGDVEDEDTPETGEDWAFDWDTEEFFGDQIGNPLRVTGEDAVIEWAEKALRTPKGAYAVYSDDYGSELQALIGQPMPEEARAAEIERAVEECLTYHPRIADVVVEEIGTRPDQPPDALFITAQVYIDDGVEPVLLEVAA
jgi:phage baseplate assembly protein W